MGENALMRLHGVSCVVGGIFLAAFVLIHPWDQLLGAEIARTPQWRLAHTFHFIGAAFALLGLPGLFVQQRAALGWIGTAGFVLSFMGNAMFLGTGMITAFIWPMLAVYAPTCVAVGGPIFASPVSVLAFVLTAVILVTGYLLFGIVTIWIGVLPRMAMVILVTGAILGMLPPHPVGPLPWWALVLGGVLYGVGLVWLRHFPLGKESAGLEADDIRDRLIASAWEREVPASVFLLMRVHARLGLARAPQRRQYHEEQQANGRDYESTEPQPSRWCVKVE